MYSSIEVKVMTHAIGRCWSNFDTISSSGGDQAAAAAAALAAVEESAFIIGSSSMRALQTRCVMVAVVFMHRSLHPKTYILTTSCRQLTATICYYFILINSLIIVLLLPWNQSHVA
jgi:hypothetical protein